MALTAKEEKFCQEYIQRLNKTQAAIAAGYSKKTAKEIGYENFTKPHIKDRITEIRAEIKEKLGIDDHSVLTEFASLGYWNIQDFINRGNKIKDLTRMDRNKLKPISGIKVTEKTITTGKTTKKLVTTELKFIDKRGPLGDLGRHLGIFEEDNKQQAIKIKVTRK